METQTPVKQGALSFRFFLIGAGIGALLMFFFDPVGGRRRRAHVRDKMVHYRKEVNWYGHKKARDLKNRAHGVVARASRYMHTENRT